jgi:1-aminocyclopropane-1-carboxylate deaminase/D-cysteine desulfhydrase-like pyridoxal-dependent ACC family enzyme
MSVVNYLDAKLPGLATIAGRVQLADLPTPVRRSSIRHAGRDYEIGIKLDNLSGHEYGGNKVRKLEYLLHPRTRKRVRRIATFGTVGSNHALATAIYAKELGLNCTCFLAHQSKVATIAPALCAHVRLGTEIVRYGGNYGARLKILRDRLWNRDAWVVPAGGSSWTGTLGFVNAGLELAAQVEAAELPMPRKVYVATGTMGTAAGLALGLALGRLPVEVHAVRVSDTSICNEQVMSRLLRKTALMMRSADATVPPNLAALARVRLRHSFFAGGYAHTDDRTDAAVRFAEEQLGLKLETTYTGKAMAAMLHDLAEEPDGGECLFWNTYNSAPIMPGGNDCDDRSSIPAEFLRYFD